MTTPLFRAVDNDGTEQAARHVRHRDDVHFFRRDKSGMVKVKINLSPEEATLIEEAANGTPLMLYIHRVLMNSAKYHIERARDSESPDDLVIVEET